MKAHTVIYICSWDHWVGLAIYVPHPPPASTRAISGHYLWDQTEISQDISHIMSAPSVIFLPVQQTVLYAHYKHSKHPVYFM